MSLKFAGPILCFTLTTVPHRHFSLRDRRTRRAPSSVAKDWRGSSEQHFLFTSPGLRHQPHEPLRQPPASALRHATCTDGQKRERERDIICRTCAAASACVSVHPDQVHNGVYIYIYIYTHSWVRSWFRALSELVAGASSS